MKTIKTAKKRIDWEAIERDYRAGKLTLREMAEKHGVTNGRIAQVAKEKGWNRGDLKKAISRATQALLVDQEVSTELSNAVSKAKQGLSDSVLAAAELNKQVILGHRTRLSKLLTDADKAGAKLLELADSVADVREAAVLIGAIESLARTTKSVIDKEREAYGLNDEGEKAGELDTMSDEDLDARISEHLARRS